MNSYERGIPEKVNQDGLRVGNCFRCQKEVRERDMIKVNTKRNENNKSSGDTLIICKDCHRG